MISMKDKKYFEDSSYDWVRFDSLVSDSIKHLKEVFNIRKISVRAVEVSSDSESICIGTYSRHSSYKSIDLLVD